MSYYYGNLSTCIKRLLVEKLEDLRDIHSAMMVREGVPGDYYSADEITSMFDKEENRYK